MSLFLADQTFSIATHSDSSPDAAKNTNRQFLMISGLFVSFICITIFALWVVARRRKLGNSNESHHTDLKYSKLMSRCWTLSKLPFYFCFVFIFLTNELFPRFVINSERIAQIQRILHTFTFTVSFLLSVVSIRNYLHFPCPLFFRLLFCTICSQYSYDWK